MSLKDFKNKIKKKMKQSTLFEDKFGFENGIDITDDKMVLYRKNVVIKNLIFVVNIIYTVIFAIVSFGDPTNSSNWLLTILLFPVTALVNHMLGRLIKKGSEDSLSQVMAMYVAAFYMFLSSILVYVKLKYGEVENTDGANYLSEAGYILIYISLLICAFYQNKKMLKNVFIWVLVIVTILHFTITYGIVQLAQNGNVLDTILDILKGTAIRDILIRTILLGLFMMILYIFVSMTNRIEVERKNEQAKRREVQENYTESITDIFDITLPRIDLNEDDIKENDILCQMVKKLSSLLSLTEDEINEIENYARVHINASIDLNCDNLSNEDDKFNKVRGQTKLGLELVSRINLKNKGEEILRYVLDGQAEDSYIKKTRELLKDNKSQIILICEIYISMRSVRNYKKAYNHKNTMDYMEKRFKVYFDSLVYDRFQRFDTDFESIFDEE